MVGLSHRSLGWLNPRASLVPVISMVWITLPNSHLIRTTAKRWRRSRRRMPHRGCLRLVEMTIAPFAVCSAPPWPSLWQIEANVMKPPIRIPACCRRQPGNMNFLSCPRRAVRWSSSRLIPGKVCSSGGSQRAASGRYSNSSTPGYLPDPLCRPLPGAVKKRMTGTPRRGYSFPPVTALHVCNWTCSGLVTASVTRAAAPAAVLRSVGATGSGRFCVARPGSCTCKRPTLRVVALGRWSPLTARLARNPSRHQHA